jgi:hypothetical protein
MRLWNGILVHVLRESEYNRGTVCGKTARPDLCRGRRVTGVPAVESILIDNKMWAIKRFANIVILGGMYLNEYDCFRARHK